jgi:hypothetical protein
VITAPNNSSMDSPVNGFGFLQSFMVDVRVGCPSVRPLRDPVAFVYSASEVE